MCLIMFYLCIKSMLDVKKTDRSSDERAVIIVKVANCKQSDIVTSLQNTYSL
jgi:hypothetical protein